MTEAEAVWTHTVQRPALCPLSSFSTKVDGRYRDMIFAGIETCWRYDPRQLEGMCCRNEDVPTSPCGKVMALDPQ